MFGSLVKGVGLMAVGAVVVLMGMAWTDTVITEELIKEFEDYHKGLDEALSKEERYVKLEEYVKRRVAEVQGTLVLNRSSLDMQAEVKAFLHKYQ